MVITCFVRTAHRRGNMGADSQAVTGSDHGPAADIWRKACSARSKGAHTALHSSMPVVFFRVALRVLRGGEQQSVC